MRYLLASNVPKRGGITMNYKVAINWQEDENSPTGTMYWVEVMKLDDWSTTIVEVKHHTLSVAWGDALAELQHKGEI
jgi:hypothetical protein